MADGTCFGMLILLRSVDLFIFADLQFCHFQQGHDILVLPLVSHTPPYRFDKLNYKDFVIVIHDGGMDFRLMLLGLLCKRFRKQRCSDHTHDSECELPMVRH